MNLTILRTVPLFATLLFVGGVSHPTLDAQEDPAAQLEEKAKSVLADPRFRNALRTVKQDPEAALDSASKDPEEAVREATRLFQAKTDGIDLDQLKAAASKAQADGTVTRAMEQISEAIPKATAAIDKVAPEEAADATEIQADLPAEPAPVAPVAEVPATRPPPGISGGAPTPVAMPIDPAAAIPADTPPEAAVPSAVAAADTPRTATVVAAAKVDAIPGAAPTTPQIPDSPALVGDKVPDPVPLAKKFERNAGGAFPAADRNHMEILSKESVMDNARGVLLFTGNVLIDHPDFEIKCDKLEIQLAEGVGMDGGGEAGGENFKRAIASGGMVEIKRITTDEKGKKKTQIAIARIADYNAITEDIVLSGGPPYIQDGDSFVKTNSEDAKIIMRGNGLYEITGSTNRSQIVIPIENKPGDGKGKGKGKGKGGGGTGLEGLTDRFR